MKRRQVITLIVLLGIFLLACQAKNKPDTEKQVESNSDVKLVQAVAGDLVDTAGMTRLREFSTDLDMDNAEESIELYTAAEQNAQGEMVWDDGQNWVLVVRDGEKSYPLLSQYVQLGAVYFTVSQNGEVQIPNITVIVPTGASFSVMSCAYDKDKGGFVGKKAYESKDDNWIYSSIPGY